MSAADALKTAPPWVALLESVLRQSVSLPGALCRNQPPAPFDAETDDQAAQAIELCRRCPELPKCRAWADSLPDKVVSGVVGGELREWYAHPSLRRRPRGRPRKAVL